MTYSHKSSMMKQGPRRACPYPHKRSKLGTRKAPQPAKHRNNDLPTQKKHDKEGNKEVAIA
jgi:hypothetical protein